jgi:hypothetical protein
MNLAKSLIVSEKNYCNRRAPMQRIGSFWPKFHHIFTHRLHRSIRYSRTKNAVHSYLRNRTTAHIEYVMIVLLKIWWNFEYVNSLSLRDTHQFKKAKYWNIGHFCSEKRKNFFRWVNPASLIIVYRKMSGSNPILINSFHAMAVILQPTFGVLFWGGVYLPQKWGVCFVWAAPPLL